MSTPARGNGLPAESWASIGHVDPRLVADLLQGLAERGIAARAEPAQGRSGPYLEVRLPAVPQDEVRVDARHRDGALELLGQLQHDHLGDVDAQFAALVADWEPSDLDEAGPTSSRVEPAASPPASVTVWRGAGQAFDPEAAEAALEADEHYVPPPPPPVPRPPLQAVLAGLLLCLGIAALALSEEALWRFVGAASIITGLAGLVLLLRDDDEPVDPFDDGARV